MTKGDRTFQQSAVIFISGMVLPGIVVVLAGDLLLTGVSYNAFLGMLALGFSLLTIACLELLEFDRLTFFFASFVWPWMVFLATLFVVLLLNKGEQIPEGPVADVVHTLWGNSQVWGTTPSDSALAYPATFMVAGGISVGIHRFYHRITREPRKEAE